MGRILTTIIFSVTLVVTAVTTRVTEKMLFDYGLILSIWIKVWWIWVAMFNMNRVACD